jgi:hypothetical protein
MANGMAKKNIPQRIFFLRYNIQYDLLMLTTRPDMTAKRKPISAVSCRKKNSTKAACSVVMPIDLQAAIIETAIREDRSFSAVVRRAIATYVRGNGTAA